MFFALWFKMLIRIKSNLVDTTLYILKFATLDCLGFNHRHPSAERWDLDFLFVCQIPNPTSLQKD